MRRQLWVIVAVLALLLAGCSSTTFVYNRLDFFVPWYVGKYVHLDHDQKQELRVLLEPFLEWHREEELPAYLALLDRAELELEQPVTAAQLEALGEALQEAWSRIESRGLEWMIALAEGLSEEQLAEFMAELRDKQADYEEEDLGRDDEEYRKDARENLEEQLEDLLGRIDADQEALLDEAASKLWRADRTWLAERARWLDRLEQILQREPGWKDELRRAIAGREAYNSAEYLETYEHNAAVLYAVIAEVLNSRSERQEKHLRREIEDLREDLSRLMHYPDAA